MAHHIGSGEVRRFREPMSLDSTKHLFHSSDHAVESIGSTHRPCMVRLISIRVGDLLAHVAEFLLETLLFDLKAVNELGSSSEPLHARGHSGDLFWRRSKDETDKKGLGPGVVRGVARGRRRERKGKEEGGGGLDRSGNRRRFAVREKSNLPQTTCCSVSHRETGTPQVEHMTWM